ncbi:MAG: PadR family transcriptional regulator [Acidimicrobiales bacterium]
MVPGDAQDRTGEDEVRAQLLAQLRRGALEYCVMAMLGDEPRYGFDLVRSLSERPGMETGEGTVYPLLTRLRKEGKVDTTWHPSESGPPRRYHTLTATGRASLDQFERAWSTFRDSVDSIMEGRATR